MTFASVPEFALERYFGLWEFAVKRQLSASDVEPFKLAELLPLADDDARRRWEALSLGYTESMGLPALRDAIAGLYTKMRAPNVLVAAGAEEGIFLLMHALVGPGDEVVVVTPAYQSLQDLPASLGAKVHAVPLRSERGWQLDPDEVARVANNRTRLIVANFPHNPTGALIPRDVQAQLVKIADSIGATLFSDEVYRGLEADPATRLPAGADLYPKAVSLGVMSKSYALPGLRIGWLATHDAALLERMTKLKDYTTICSSAPSEVLALIALRASERVLQRSRDIVTANRGAAAQFIAAHPSDLEWVSPEAGSTAFPRFLRTDADSVAAKLREEESVLLVPGRIFGADNRHFRLGLGRRDLPQALESLGRVLA
jgi:aspartate/methionine/tyrosine aminotransferase